MDRRHGSITPRALAAGFLTTLAVAGCSGDRDTTMADGTDDSATLSGSSADGTGTSDTASTSGASNSGPTTASTSADTSGTGPLFDVGSGIDLGNNSGECGCGNSDWSYIWIANSSEHTVSKINTRTLVEEGRYRTRPDSQGNPSRTSVSIDGKAVAIANRMTGLTKIWALEEFCDDKNANNMIDTSTGPGDVLAFDAEECIAWHTDIPDMTVQRPVAWTSGTLNPETCEYENQKVWTATGADSPMGDNYCGPSGVWVHRLDGETGVVEDTIHIPENEVPCVFGSSDWGFGFYGGAVDPDDNFWLSTFGAGKFVKVDYDTMDYTVWNGSSYGITVDTLGRPWVGDAPQRFDPMAGTWQSSGAPGAGGSGIAEDLQGRMWAATSGGVLWVDRDTLAIGDTVTLPESGLARGISVDVDGYIWAVILGGTKAYKIDPDTYDIEEVDGLNGPYTYSDMTGGQLSNVTCNRPEG